MIERGTRRPGLPEVARPLARYPGVVEALAEDLAGSGRVAVLLDDHRRELAAIVPAAEYREYRRLQGQAQEGREGPYTPRGAIREAGAAPRPTPARDRFQSLWG